MKLRSDRGLARPQGARFARAPGSRKNGTERYVSEDLVMRKHLRGQRDAAARAHSAALLSPLASHVGAARAPECHSYNHSWRPLQSKTDPSGTMVQKKQKLRASMSITLDCRVQHVPSGQVHAQGCKAHWPASCPRICGICVFAKICFTKLASGHAGCSTARLETAQHVAIHLPASTSPPPAVAWFSHCT